MKSLKITWTKQAQLGLKEVFEFYRYKSTTAAKKIVKELLASPKTIYFSRQYQIDEINPKYRRIIVGDYKVLYTEKNNEITIVDIVCTRQSPSVLESK
jgi:plasmid stabilization system protein ParE